MFHNCCAVVVKTSDECHVSLVKAKRARDLYHPRKFNKSGTAVKFSVCSTKTGAHGLGKSFSDLATFGVGIVLYFKFLVR